jgi:DNA-binding PadR family transcriptional regulator
MANTSAEQLPYQPLTPAAFHILLSLADGEKHGYAIMQEVEVISEGQVKLGPGILYGTIKRLVEDGLIQESEQRPDPSMDDQRRRYYHLTGEGRQELADEANRLANLVAQAQARQVLRPVP